MRFLSKLLVVLLISSISFMGCSSKNEPKEEMGKTTKDAGLNTYEKTKEYEVIKEDLVDANRNIHTYYPKIKTNDEKLNEEINAKLKNIPSTFALEEAYQNVNLDYEVKREDKTILSILYKGDGTISDVGNIKIMDSVNIDIPTGDEITYDNFIKSDEKSREKVKELLDSKAKEKGLSNFEAEGIRLYFTNDKVNFYYMPLDDSAKEFVELEVSYDEIKDYITTSF